MGCCRKQKVDPNKEVILFVLLTTVRCVCTFVVTAIITVTYQCNCSCFVISKDTDQEVKTIFDKRRSCTDVICLAVFGAFLVGMVRRD